MQPAASGLDGTGVKLMKGDASGTVLVNDAAFMKMKIQDVPVDEVCFITSFLDAYQQFYNSGILSQIFCTKE